MNLVPFSDPKIASKSPLHCATDVQMGNLGSRVKIYEHVSKSWPRISIKTVVVWQESSKLQEPRFFLRYSVGHSCHCGTAQKKTSKGSYGCFRKHGYSQIIHFNKVFHYKPSILGHPYFWKHPYSFISNFPGGSIKPQAFLHYPSHQGFF